MKERMNKKEILKHLNFLDHTLYWFHAFKPNLCGVKQDGHLHGEFCSKERIIELCERYNGKGLCCVAINERPSGKTKKEDVKTITTLVIDIDVRKSKRINYVSTGDDHVHAQKKANDIKTYLEEKGYLVGLIIDSGNGAQVYLKVNIPIFSSLQLDNYESKIKAFEEDLRQFNNDVVEVDFITKDRNRRIKIAGTINKKDTHQQEDRISKITYFASELHPEKNTEIFHTINSERIQNKLEINQPTVKTIDNSRSGKEFREILKYVRLGYTKEKIFNEMKTFNKWFNESNQYRERTYNRAIELHSSKHDSNGGNGSNDLKMFLFTKHLPKFEELVSICGLQGREYHLILKGVYYHIVSKIITKHVKNISLGNLKIDPRLHLLIVIPSGQGKKNIKSCIINILSELGFKCHVPTSLNPEQLIGKVVNKGTPRKPEYEPNLGYFSRDWLGFDEMDILLTSKDLNLKESRKNLRISKDPIGENRVEKKSVDNSFDSNEVISFYPTASVCGFTQPKHLPPDIVEEGDMRRDLVLYVPSLSDRIKDEDFANRLMMKNNSEKDLKGFVNFCESIDMHLPGEEFKFEMEAVLRLIKLHNHLVKFGLSHSNKGRNFTKMVDFTLQDMFVKMCLVQGIIHEKKKITPELVELAFMDLVEFFSSQLNFVKNKVNGSLDYGEGWSGSQGKDRQCLQWLHESGAYSLETGVKGKEFKEIISQIKNIKPDMAIKTFQKFRTNGWIDFKQSYQESIVWLKFIPKIESKISSKKEKKCAEAYNSIYLKLKTQSTPLPPLPSLLPCEEEVVV